MDPSLFSNQLPSGDLEMASKITMTVRMDAPQYNEVIAAAQAMNVSLNQYCLMMLDVQRNKNVGKVRGRRPKLRSIEPKSKQESS